MDFEQWFKGHRYSDTPLCYGAAKDGFKSGQQSKQEEVNKLQKEIDKVKELLNQWDNWSSVSDKHNCIEIVKECADELRELLK